MSGEDRASAFGAGLPMNGAGQAVSAVPVGIPDADRSQSLNPSKGCDLCADPDDGSSWYPMYGVAPHECYWRKGPQFTIGQSTLVPITPEDCFVPELEAHEDWSHFRYPAATGVYYCPNCHADRYQREWNKLIERIGPPPAPVAIEARQGGNGAAGSVHESAGLKGTGKKQSETPA